MKIGKLTAHKIERNRVEVCGPEIKGGGITQIPVFACFYPVELDGNEYTALDMAKIFMIDLSKKTNKEEKK
ncbi:unnamed protein product [marine sediment metagenome]|uniref:Uncharacterized protein n=1 Tax=marine sediment metagenome TaxID=412755 RepID=X0ZTS3_9ZZZZ